MAQKRVQCLFHNYNHNKTSRGFIFGPFLVLSLFLLIFSYPFLMAQTDAKKNKVPNVLDFEADVIEGERTAPSILIQMDLQSPKLDTLVFQRKNFNDFHTIDMKRKPKYRGGN